MLQTVHETLGAIVGFIYLHVKYPNRATRVDILDNDYNNDYSNAGTIILLNSIYIILGAVLGLFILVMLWRGAVNLVQFLMHL